MPERSFSHHIKWTPQETEIVKEHYPQSTAQEMRDRLPGRTSSQIQSKAYSLGIRKVKQPKMSDEEMRNRKRESMAKLRAADPELANKKQMDWYHKNRDRQTEVLRKYYRKRFFWGRAMKLRGPDRASTLDLANLWKEQRGFCALSGRRLDRDNAQLDHIVPKALGGGDEISNLQWLHRDVNYAKRALTNEDYMRLCKEVVYCIPESCRAEIEGRRG